MPSIATLTTVVSSTQLVASPVPVTDLQINSSPESREQPRYLQLLPCAAGRPRSPLHHYHCVPAHLNSRKMPLLSQAWRYVLLPPPPESTENLCSSGARETADCNRGSLRPPASPHVLERSQLSWIRRRAIARDRDQLSPQGPQPQRSPACQHPAAC